MTGINKRAEFPHDEKKSKVHKKNLFYFPKISRDSHTTVIK